MWGVGTKEKWEKNIGQKWKKNEIKTKRGVNNQKEKK
jgi:hypothetical protein